MMVHAHVGDEFYDFALDQAWKIFNCLPIRGLEKNGHPTTPHELFYNLKPNLSRFRVMFCPVIMNTGPKTYQKRVRDRRNNPERGIRGIHVGVAQRSDGWLVYVPSINAVYPSKDVTFDEHFRGTLARLSSRVRMEGGVALQPHPQAITGGERIEVVGDNFPAQRGENDAFEEETNGLHEDHQLIQNPETTPPLYFDVESPGPEHMRWGNPHYDPELANSDLTSVGYTASQDDTQFDESDVTDSDASDNTHKHEEHIEGSGKTITWKTALEGERVYHPNLPASQSLRRSKRLSKKQNYFTNTLQFEDSDDPLSPTLNLQLRQREWDGHI